MEVANTTWAHLLLRLLLLLGLLGSAAGLHLSVSLVYLACDI